MAEPVYKIQHRRGTIESWTLADPVLGDGEIGVLSGTSLAKMGDGVTKWTLLPYFTHDLSDAPPVGGGSASPGTSLEVSRADHIHPLAPAEDFVKKSGDLFTGSPSVQIGTGAVQNLHAASIRVVNEGRTGYLLIKLPGPTAKSAMLDLIVRGYDYTNDVGSWRLDIGGYAYNASGWLGNKQSAFASGKFPGKLRRLPVAFLTKGSLGAREYAIAIGTTTTAWSNPFVVLDILAGYNGPDLVYQTGYTMSFTTDLTGWTTFQTITPETPYAPNAGGYRYMSHPAQSLANEVFVTTTGWTPVSGDYGNGIITYSNGSFTINESGLYDISWNCSFSPNMVGTRIAALNVNDTDRIIIRPGIAATGHASGVNSFQGYPFNAGNVLKLNAYQSSGAALNLSGLMSIRKVGELP